MSFPLFLLAVAAVAAWLGSLWLHPFGACPRCHGHGHITRGKPQGRKPKPPKVTTCPRCKGAARRQRPGSRTLHQLARRVSRELARQRHQRHAERTEARP